MTRRSTSGRIGIGAVALFGALLVLAVAAFALGRSAADDPPKVAAPGASAVPSALRAELATGRRGGSGVAFPSAASRRAPATIWAVGDGANGSDEARTLARRIAAGRPERVLYLGDVYESGTPDEFKRNVTGVYGGLRPIMVPTPGNHDWGNRERGYDPYWQAITGRPTPHWFAFTIGGWRIVSVNSEEPAEPRQLRLLEREVARRADRCLIVMLHRPRLNAGRHGDAESTEPIWSRVRGRATLVLAGHDHNLQRFRPVDGTTQLVIGAGGRERYGVDHDDPRLAFARDDVDGALRLRLRPGRADLRIVAAAGQVVDRTSVTCAG